MSATDVARALGGHHCGAGGYLCRCPIPTHGKGNGDRRPSLSIKDGDEALLIKCHAGCNSRDVLDELRRRGLLDDGGDRRRFRRDAFKQPAPIPEPEPDPQALALWHAAEPIVGSLGAEYLHGHRSIGLDAPPSLRFLTEALYPHTGHHFPAIVAAVQRPDRKIIAAQVTYLRPSDRARRRCLRRG